MTPPPAAPTGSLCFSHESAPLRQSLPDEQWNKHDRRGKYETIEKRHNSDPILNQPNDIAIVSGNWYDLSLLEDDPPTSMYI